MPESYKKWILTGIAFIVGFIVAFAFFAPSFKNRDVAESSLQNTSSSPPQFETDPNLMRTLSVEELGVDTRDPQSLARLGDQYFESGNFGQAVEIYKKTLEINPNDIDTYNDLGLAYLYTGNPDLAEEILLKGIEIAPEYQRIWLSLGFILKSAGKNEKARPILQNAMDMDPNNDIGLEAMRMLEQL
jgi:tetratricopeptide (TPR) repeat protein